MCVDVCLAPVPLSGFRYCMTHRTYCSSAVHPFQCSASGVRCVRCVRECDVCDATGASDAFRSSAVHLECSASVHPCGIWTPTELREVRLELLLRAASGPYAAARGLPEAASGPADSWTAGHLRMNCSSGWKVDVATALLCAAMIGATAPVQQPASADAPL